MSELYYKQKYLKYKQKYLNLNGGFGDIPHEAIQLVESFMNECIINYTHTSPDKLKELTLSFSKNIIKTVYSIIKNAMVKIPYRM
jgi:hypothetical protein